MSVEQEARVNAILQENVVVINRIRDNLLNGHLNLNVDLMSRFRNNIIAVSGWCVLPSEQSTLSHFNSSRLGSLPITMPPLPVQISPAVMDEDGTQSSSTSLTEVDKKPDVNSK